MTLPITTIFIRAKQLPSGADSPKSYEVKLPIAEIPPGGFDEIRWAPQLITRLQHISCPTLIPASCLQMNALMVGNSQVMGECLVYILDDFFDPIGQSESHSLLDIGDIMRLRITNSGPVTERLQVIILCSVHVPVWWRRVAIRIMTSLVWVIQKADL